jgi:hypothetical protein
MKRISLICLLALTPSPGVGAEAQMLARAMNRDKLAAEFRTVVSPAGAEQSWGSGVNVGDDGIFHRYLLDNAQKVYVGYDVRVEEGSNSDQFVLTIAPFTLERHKLPVDGPQDWTSIPLIQMPRSQALAPLESVALDLLVNHNTGQKVVDYITVGRNINRLDRPRGKRGAPRPFKAEEAEMELHDPVVMINGEKVHDGGMMAVSGATIGFYLKDRGRFLLTLLPYEELGFQNAGWVSGSGMQFEWAGDKFEIESRRRIAPGGGAFHLYLLHDPAFRPTGGLAKENFYLFAAGKPAMLLH